MIWTFITNSLKQYLNAVLFFSLPQTAQSLTKTHQNTTSTLLALESQLVTLQTRAVATLRGTQQVVASELSLRDSVAAHITHLGQLNGFVVDGASIDRRVGAARALTQSYTSQVGR